MLLPAYNGSPESGYLPVKELLARTRDFTAIFCFNDIAAIGAMRALKDAGLRVPEDVSVIGFDDILGASYHTPSITTVRQPLEEMGREGARTLFERIATPSRGVRTRDCAPTGADRPGIHRDGQAERYTLSRNEMLSCDSCCPRPASSPLYCSPSPPPGLPRIAASQSGDFPCSLSANEPLLDQAQRFLLAELRLQPVEATQAGYHGDAQTPLDTRLDDLGPGDDRRPACPAI